MKHLKPHGPRGVMLLGFALLALTFGYAYITAKSPGTLAWLDDRVPLEYLGWLWVGTGIWLAISAFRIGQSKALVLFSGMCAGAGTAYAISCIIALQHGQPAVGYTLVAVFYALSIACGAAVRMVNPAASHLEIVVKPGHREDGT